MLQAVQLSILMQYNKGLHTLSHCLPVLRACTPKNLDQGLRHSCSLQFVLNFYVGRSAIQNHRNALEPMEQQQRLTHACAACNIPFLLFQVLAWNDLHAGTPTLCDPGCCCDKQVAPRGWAILLAGLSGTTASLLLMVPSQSEAGSWGLQFRQSIPEMRQHILLHGSKTTAEGCPPILYGSLDSVLLAASSTCSDDLHRR